MNFGLLKVWNCAKSLTSKSLQLFTACHDDASCSHHGRDLSHSGRHQSLLLRPPFFHSFTDRAMNALPCFYPPTRLAFKSPSEAERQANNNWCATGWWWNTLQGLAITALRIDFGRKGAEVQGAEVQHSIGRTCGQKSLSGWY